MTKRPAKKKIEVLQDKYISDLPKGRLSIKDHEGSKYRKMITSCDPDGGSVWIDVYSVINSFEVTCPATAHAIKKLLCAGQRGKGNRAADLQGALAALNRAIDFEDE